MDFGLDGKGSFIYAGQLEVPMIIANNPNMPKDIRSDMLTSNLEFCKDVKVLRHYGVYWDNEITPKHD